MQLQARRQKQVSVRATRKQRGGAAWQATRTAMASTARRDDWIAFFAKDMPELSPLLDDGVKDENIKVSTWIRAVEKQDELFKAAITLFKQKIGFEIKPDFSNITLLNDPRAKEFLSSYVSDVLAMLQLGKPPKPSDPSKLDLLLGPQYDPLKIVHFPNILTNTFAKTLATVILSLKGTTPLTNTPMKDILRQATADTAIVKLLADQFKGHVYVNSYYLTSMEPIEGIYLEQSVAEFRADLDTFFVEMITELARLISTGATPDDVFKTSTVLTCDHNIEASSWGYIAAHVAYWYMLEKPLDELFSNFSDCTRASLKPKDITARKAFVPDSVLTPGVKIDDIPLVAIFKSMTRQQFLFLAHLRAILKSLA